LVNDGPGCRAVLGCLLLTIPVTGNGEHWAVQAVLGKDRDLPPPC
jgi:hypothetical protein